MSASETARAPAPWTDHEVRDALLLRSAREHDDLRFPGVSTDTRTLAEGDLFVALEGPNFDGHDFLSEAAARGARGAVVHRSAPSEGLLVLYPVRDTLVALGAMAAHRRSSFSARVVGLTGSSGKTTVKELLRAALATTFRVHATRGNLNNRIGLPRTLLDTPPDAEIVLVELGTSQPGEIATLTDIARPDAGILTTVGEAHLEQLGSLEGVMEEKLALVDGVEPDGWVVVGDEPAALPDRARARHEGVIVAGLTERADGPWRGERVDVDPEGRWELQVAAGRIHCGLPGAHGARNSLLALAAALQLGVPFDEATRVIEAARSPAMRGEVLALGTLHLVVDCYNANPQSTRAALDLLRRREARGPRVAVLGSMLELGDHADELHRAVLDEALDGALQIVVAVGDFARAARALGEPPAGVTLLMAGDAGEAWDVLQPHLTGNETVLLKGSRGVELEVLVPRFERAFGGSDAAPDPEET